MKSPKVEDLRFNGKTAFEQLSKLGRAILSVDKKKIEGKELKKSRVKRPLAGARSS